LGPAESVESDLKAASGHVLLAVQYGGLNAGLHTAEHPFVEVPTPVLGGTPWLEVWHSPERAECFRRGGLAWAEDGHALFGSCCRQLGRDLEHDTHAAFRDILALLNERGYAGLQRVWNHVPAINEEQDGLERYRRFNLGRARAFEELYGVDAEQRFPASSAVGTVGDTFIACFAAARSHGTHLENPRQVSAYHYPRHYGPKSPSFARATVAPPDWGPAFFLSGTASVVGHETVRVGDPSGQLDETLINIDALLAEVATRTGRGIGFAHFDLVKVFIREREHFPAIRETLARRLGTETPVLYLHADICRSDLLVEIEGVAL
jgi:chorismate lyase/3-hydroxybenzoate synthase